MTTRSWRLTRNIALAFGAAVVVGLAGGVLLASGGRAPAGAAVVVIGLLSAAAMAACLPWWRSIDDGARDAHKTAWWWGGSFGALAGFFCIAPSPGARSPLAVGAVVFGSQVVAYAVAWAGWWLARRPRLAM